MAVQPVDIHDRAVQAYDLHNLFPKEGYKKDRKVVAHYLILYKNHPAVVSWLNKYPEYLSEKATQFQLTPLHMSAIVGDFKTTEYLLSKGVHTHELDARKWTSLHHAALHQNPEMLDLLLKIDATRGNPASPLKNENNGTYDDLRQWAFPQQRREPNIEDAIVLNYRDHEGKIVGGTVSTFQEMTGAQFVSQMHVDPGFFIDEWKDPTEISNTDREISASMEDSYFSFLHTPPLLYLDKTEASGCGVFSAGLIMENTVVIDYLGWATHGGGNSLYAMKLCDGTKKRNFGPMMNDGFPNCVDMSLCNIKGIPILHAFRAIRPIEQGEQILWNYGQYHPVKIGKYINLAGDNPVKWLQDRAILERYTDLGNWVNENTDNVNFSVDFRNRIAPFHYLLCTHSFQIISLLKRIITINDLYTLSKQTYFAQRAGDTERPDNLFRRQDLDRNFATVNFFFNFCSQLEEPSIKEKEVVTIVEHLFSQIKVSTFFGFIETLSSALEEPGSFVQTLLKEAIEGNPQQREKLLTMAIDFERYPNLH